jgi:hypothetical protein
VAGSCAYGDEPSGSGATDLVTLLKISRRCPLYIYIYIYQTNLAPPPPTSRRRSPKAIPCFAFYSLKSIQPNFFFCFQLPDIHPNKLSLVNDELPDRFILPPVSIASIQNVSRPSDKTANPLAYHNPGYCSQGSLLQSQLCFSYAGMV